MSEELRFLEKVLHPRFAHPLFAMTILAIFNCSSRLSRLVFELEIRGDIKLSPVISWAIDSNISIHNLLWDH